MLIQGRQTVQIEGSLYKYIHKKIHKIVQYFFHCAKITKNIYGIFWKMQNFSQKNTEKISISYMDLLTFCPAPPLPRPGDFDPCPAPPRPAPEILTLALPRPDPPRRFLPLPRPAPWEKTLPRPSLHWIGLK